jgi:hypothetical protein
MKSKWIKEEVLERKKKKIVYSLLHKCVHLLWPVDFHMGNIFCWEADVEIFVLVLFCHAAE